MEKHLKKRIVGAVVTVTAVAITFPVIIDGSRKQLTLDDDIPAMPPMPEWAKVENQKRIKIDLEKLASGDAARHLTPPPMDTSPTDDPVPVPPPTADEIARVLAANAESASASSLSGSATSSSESNNSTNKTASAVAAKPAGTPKAETKAAAPEPTPVPKAPDPKDAPQLDDNNLPFAWVVQLGAFASEENARKFRDKLRDQGIKSYTNTQIDGLTRVYAGPELKREAAESLRQRLVLLLDKDNLPIKRYRAR